MQRIRDRLPFGIGSSVVRALIAVNLLIFVIEMVLPESALDFLFTNGGLVPARITQALRGDGSLLTGILIPVILSMFLHGGFWHVLFNMWGLHLFGGQLEATLGHRRFALFYLFCGLAAGLTHYLMGVNSPVPMIGASGAIAGVLGAFAITWPRTRITLFMPFPITMPVIVACGLWFAIDLFGGIRGGGGVANWAHIGGLLAGIGVMRLLFRRRPHAGRDDWWRQSR